MNEEFDIISYMSGLTSFVFDRSVLERIALDRGVITINQYDERESKSYAELTQRDKDLLRADMLYTAYCGPNVIPNHSQTHGAYTKSVGAQTVNKSDLYQIFMGLYQKYDDAMLDVVGSNLQWLD